jgi:signal transduction histidine kinase
MTASVRKSKEYLRTEAYAQSQIRSDVVRLLWFLSQVSAGIVLLIGTLVLIGWLLNNNVLKSIVPTLPSMKANTSIAFIFSGLALWVSQNERNTFVRYIRYICGSTVFIIAIATLFQYLMGINIGIDVLFFQEPPGALGTAFPNRMAANSALLFCLCGLAIILIDKKLRNIWIGQILVIFAFIVLLPTIIGYTYNIDFIYGISTTTKMAIHTAISFLLTGILIARPLHGFMAVIVRDDAGGYLSRRLIVTAVIIPLLLGWVILRGYQSGIYDANFQFLLLIATCVIVFTYLIWRNAISLSIIDSRRKKVEENTLFLSEATSIMNTSLDYKLTLKKVADISVPTFADICYFDLLQTNGSLKRIAWKNIKTLKIESYVKKHIFSDSSLHKNHPRYTVIHTKKPFIITQVTNEWLKSISISTEHYNFIRKLYLREIIIVPLLIHNEALGTVTFCLTNKSNNSYSKDDVIVAQEVASRIAIAVKNAILYSDAKKAIHLRDDFISVASHELKTPVTSIKAYGQVLEKMFRRRNDTKTANQLAKMDVQINKLNHLISDLLNVTKIQSGRLQLYQEYFNISNLVREIVEEMQPMSERHVLNTELDEQCDIYGDKERIAQVIVNFITNAIKYSPHADKITIKTKRDGNNVIVSVQDFGVGIKKNYQNKVFEQFFRVSESKQNTYPGLGLGLYISSEIIKRQGGKIWVESTERKGSTFSFSMKASANQLGSHHG